MDGKWKLQPCSWSVGLQNPGSWLPLHHTQSFVGQNKSFPSRLLPASRTTQYHPEAPTVGTHSAFVFLGTNRSVLLKWWKSVDKVTDVTPAASLRGSDFRVPLDLPITRMTYFGQSKIRFLQQTAENWKTDQWKQRWFISNDFIGCSYQRLNNAFMLRVGSLRGSKAIFKDISLLNMWSQSLKWKEGLHFF